MTKSVGYTNEPITNVELEKPVYAGIMYSVLSEYIVPVAEEHICRLKAGYTLNEWYALAPLERAFEVAMQRVISAIEGHQSEAAMKDK